METASYLAGERWSDHPTCTHPLLGSLARLVKDALTDSERSQLLSLIPDVVGLTGDDPLIDMAIATSAPAAALPVGSAPSQSRRDATSSPASETTAAARWDRSRMQVWAHKHLRVSGLLSPSTGPASSSR